MPGPGLPPAAGPQNPSSGTGPGSARLGAVAPPAAHKMVARRGEAGPRRARGAGRAGSGAGAGPRAAMGVTVEVHRVYRYPFEQVVASYLRKVTGPARALPGQERLTAAAGPGRGDRPPRSPSA